jgi:hypothetical protein
MNSFGRTWVQYDSFYNYGNQVVDPYGYYRLTFVPTLNTNVNAFNTVPNNVVLN